MDKVILPAARASLVPVIVAILTLSCSDDRTSKLARTRPTSGEQNKREPVSCTSNQKAGALGGSEDSTLIPDSASIEKMTVEIYAHPLAFPDVGPLEVPREDYDRILAFFRGLTKPDTSASQMDEEAGTIRLFFPYHTSIRLCWFYMGKDARLSFSSVGMRYTTTGKKLDLDEALELDSTIRQIQKELADESIEKRVGK